MAENDHWRQQVSLLSEGRYIRFIVIQLLVGGIGLLIGAAFMLLFLGILNSIFRLAPYWYPAFRFSARLMGVKDIPASLDLPPLPTWHWVLVGLRQFLWGLMILAGFWVLVQYGFLGQNILYLILSR